MNSPIITPNNPTVEQLHVAMVNEFALPYYIRAELKSYYVLHWQKDYLFHKIDCNGMITHADVEYIPIFKTALNNPLITGVRLSFREAHPYLCIPAYVLIKAK